MGESAKGRREGNAGLAALAGVHGPRCRLTVETWLLRALPVSRSLLNALWPDPAWRAALTDVVVRPSTGGEDGLLRDIDPERGLMVLGADSQRRWLEPDWLTIPHPALIADLGRFREIVGPTRRPAVSQVFREVAARPQGLASGLTQCGDFAGVTFSRAEKLLRRCGRYGFAVRHGYATCRLWDRGAQHYEARFYLGEEDPLPNFGVTTGALTWIDRDGWDLPLAEVGLVGWSEGVRMARLLTEGERPVQPDDSGARWLPAAGAYAAVVGEPMPVRMTEYGGKGGGGGERGAGRIVVPLPINPTDRDRTAGLDEPVRPRTWRHRTHADPVVRLVADPLAHDVDAAMERLGYAPVSVGEVLATCPAVALDFLDYALARDPENSEHALAATTELTKLAETAAVRPADARRGYTDVARKVRAKAPALTIRIHEQATRAFVMSGYERGQERTIEKAIQAKDFHTQPSDTEHLRRLAIEIALAGGTSAVLDAYAAAMEAEAGPAHAAEAVRSVVVGLLRTGTIVDPDPLRLVCAVAQRAGHAPDEVAAALLPEVIAGPGLADADALMQSEAFTGLARRDPAVRAALRVVRPRQHQRLASGSWLEILEATGALDELVSSAGGAVGQWLSRVVATVQLADDYGWNQVWKHYAPLLTRLAPRLRSDGVAVDLTGGLLHRASVELLDLAVELGVELTDPPAIAGDRLQIRYGEGERSLAHLAADGRFLDHLLEGARWDPTHVEGRPGLYEPLARKIFAGMADLGKAGGLAALSERLRSYRQADARLLLPTYPTAIAAFAAIDVAPPLAATLRGGLLDEFGWPALEQVIEGLPPAHGNCLTVLGSWPYLIVKSGFRAIVVGADGVVFDGDSPTPQDAAMTYVDGELFLPDPAARQFQECANTVLPYSLSTPDGRRTDGGAAYGPGATRSGEPQRLFSDGRSFWRVDGGTLGFWYAPTTQLPTQSARLHGFDPLTGEALPSAPPELVSSAEAAGMAIDLETSWLLPVPEDGHSPLGQVGGVAGIAIGIAGDGRRRVRRVDGTDLEVGVANQTEVAIPVDLPGSDQKVLLRFDTRYLNWFYLVSPDDGHVLGQYLIGEMRPPTAPGTPMVVPPIFWNYLAPRDPQGSAALRVVDAPACREMIAALESGESPSQVVARLLSAVQHPDLVVGVVAALEQAVSLAAQAHAIAALAVVPPRPEPPAEQALAPLGATQYCVAHGR